MTVFGIIKYEISWRLFSLTCSLIGMGRADQLWDRLFWHREPIDEEAIYGDD